MRFHRSSCGRDNFDETTTVLVSTEYDEQSGYDPSEYDDNDVTIGGDIDREFVTSAKKFANFNEFSEIKKIRKNS